MRVIDSCAKCLYDKQLARANKSEDAVYVGIDREVAVIPNGSAVAGTIYHLISEKAKKAIDEADVILAKGQGNYESMSGQGRNLSV